MLLPIVDELDELLDRGADYHLQAGIGGGCGARWRKRRVLFDDGEVGGGEKVRLEGFGVGGVDGVEKALDERLDGRDVCHEACVEFCHPENVTYLM